MYTISLGRKKSNNTSTMIYESTDMRVYDDQQQQTKNSQVCNYDIDYGSREKRNSALANQFPRFTGQ
ncbi:hypothetical protein Glove_91g92 [Diversispora epigaea]|uniref:Uncharacterized protein n=1 Tax=Diversispora epigaea TaxID=1348612 RepID=A0A397J5I6_9GLOM|nr:hypothetical protein Glove_91g92 [Diversispora epigaea]